MHTSEAVVVPAEAERVFAFVADLAEYPRWLPLVHAAMPDGDAAWTVEIRARVGPFARSKQLRMARTELVPGSTVTFERAEVDGREHARWALRCDLATVADGTLVTMHLAYDGRLWTGGILERVLDEEVRRGRAGLIDVISASSTR